MKKMLCAVAMCVALVSGAFAQEAETSASKKGGFDYHNIKIEVAVRPKWDNPKSGYFLSFYITRWCHAVKFQPKPPIQLQQQMTKQKQSNAFS